MEHVLEKCACGQMAYLIDCEDEDGNKMRLCSTCFDQIP